MVSHSIMLICNPDLVNGFDMNNTSYVVYNLRSVVIAKNRAEFSPEFSPFPRNAKVRIINQNKKGGILHIN